MKRKPILSKINTFNKNIVYNNELTDLLFISHDLDIIEKP